jgi:hypothetical protein
MIIFAIIDYCFHFRHAAIIFAARLCRAAAACAHARCDAAAERRHYFSLDYRSIDCFIFA